MYYLPYATSLRLSDLGYTNKSQSNLGITFNELHEYVAGLKRAIKTPSEEYEKIGLEKDGKRLQINSNVLQIENELYAPIRPKRVTRSGETRRMRCSAAGSNTLKCVRWISTRSHRLALMSSRFASWICLWSGACWRMRRK
jgi:gamma-glutamylcysteine synthetase